MDISGIMAGVSLILGIVNLVGLFRLMTLIENNNLSTVNLLASKLDTNDKRVIMALEIVKDAMKEGEGLVQVKKIDDEDYFTRIDPKLIYKKR